MTTTAQEPRAWPMLIGGEEVHGDGRSMDVDNPFTGSVWATVPVGEQHEVDLAVTAARAAVDGPWRSASPRERAQLLRRLSGLVSEHAEELTTLQVQENGKAIREQAAQTRGLGPHLDFFAGVAEDLTGRTIPMGEDDLLYTVREPVGVVAALTPWNSPLSLLVWKLAPALAAGNTLVIKPSEVSPVSTLRLAALCQEAGFPPGVVNVVTGDATTGGLLVADPRVDKVAFTGSTAAGRAVGRAAVDHLARLSLELGGKSANIVFADADLDLAVEGVVGGIFAAAGQTCVAGSRVLVHESIRDELVERLVERTRRIRLGDPMDWSTEVGTIACRRQFDLVLDHLASARAEGARAAVGGGRPTAPELEQGLFIEPTVLVDVESSMRVVREEIFGPVACVQSFDSDDEAVRMANETEFGLAAGVWTNDVRRAHVMARRLRSGTVWINTYRRTSYLAPFGGVGMSGIGRENGRDAVDEYTEPKTVWMGLSTAASDPFDPFNTGGAR